MTIQTQPATFSTLQEPLWLPAPESPDLPVNELHIWRARMREPRWSGDEALDSQRAERMWAAFFRKDVLGRYGGGKAPGVITGPASGLHVTAAHCDHVALLAISRNVREVGLDIERVREDIPFEEMADGFLDVRSQWDLRITWSPQEKAWKFFQFWTSNEACAQARPSSRNSQSCQVRRFSPEAGFIAALAVEGGPRIKVVHWDWVC